MAGSEPRIFGFARDITERKRAEEALWEAHVTLDSRVQERTAELQAANTALSESEARLRLALNASNAGTWSWDAVNSISTWDDRYHELYGFELHEPQSYEAWVRRVHPQDRERILARIQTLLEPGAGETWNEEFRALHPLKGERWMGSLGRIERDKAGRAVRFTGINLDITERKQMEQALREAHDELEQRVRERTAELRAANAALSQSEERYRVLAESSPDAIFILDRDLKMQYANSTTAALWRRRPEELIGLTQPELFSPEVAEYHCRVVAEVFETGKPVRREEPLAFPAGEQWIEIRLVPLFGEQDSVNSVMGISRDITERKCAERQLAEALDLNRKMIAASTIGIAAYITAGECVFANEALARTVGGTVSEVLQGNFRKPGVLAEVGAAANGRGDPEPGPSPARRDLRYHTVRQEHLAGLPHRSVCQQRPAAFAAHGPGHFRTEIRGIPAAGTAGSRGRLKSDQRLGHCPRALPGDCGEDRWT